MAASAEPGRARGVVSTVMSTVVSILAMIGLALACLPALAQTAAPPGASLPGATLPAGATLPRPADGDAPLPSFLDDQRLRVIEDVARPRLEALEQRRAEKLKRRAIEADAKRKAEEMRRSVEGQSPGSAQAAANEPKGPPALMRAGAAVAAPAVAAPALKQVREQAPAACAPPAVSSRALAGGRIALDVLAPCRPGELVTVSYAPFIFQRTLDKDGRLSFVLDLFQGADVPVTLVLASGERLPVAVGDTDIARVAKVAIVWGKPVNIDLHAFEYASPRDGGGHRWSRSPGSAEAALEATRQTKRGHGFVSFTSEGTMPGHQVEVYTLFLHPEQVSGMVTTAVDYESRGTTLAGETCGSGALATIPFETLSLRPGLPVSRERGLISPAPCGATLVEKARYVDEAVPDVEAVLK